MTTVTAVPGTGGPPNRAKNNPDGSGIPTIPASRSSKQPTSSAGPKRFFTPRTMRARASSEKRISLAAMIWIPKKFGCVFGSSVSGDL